jgi:hypothetical protein
MGFEMRADQRTDAVDIIAQARSAPAMPHATCELPGAPPLQANELSDDKLEALLGRLRHLTSEGAPALGGAAEPPIPIAPRPVTEFIPPEPKTLRETGVSEAEVSALVLKYLLNCGGATGGNIAGQMRLPFNMAQPILAQMKTDQRIIYKNSTRAGDFVCELTAAGADHARRHYKHSTYYGAVPVPLSDYVAAVGAQSITLQSPEIDDVQRALDDLMVSPKLTSRIAQALRAGRGMFLHGPAGNGKSSVAERITRAFGQHIWIPRAVSVDGEIIKLYDPCCHEELPFDGPDKPPKFDGRWIRIRRPTVVTGGELTMDRLEATLNKLTGICEAPVQMKSNCGTLVIDDFGRQRMAIKDLLNRWIVPLEKRFDFINLPSGRAVQIPFDQLIIFSTNLEPRSLVDEAFLRRIPYKIDFQDPSEAEFRGLLSAAAATLGFPPADDAVDHLIATHYRAANRPFRFCQPRDLLLQVRYYCEVHRQPLQMSAEAFDVAVENYFSVL